MYLLILYLSFFEKCLCRAAIFKVGLIFLFLLLSCVSSLYILDISHLSDMYLQLFNPVKYVAFSFSGGFLCCAELFNMT